ncbi:MAG: hypothetical protein PHV06_04400 [bacterium]|nr:hypothetical protein [bacterium]
MKKKILFIILVLSMYFLLGCASAPVSGGNIQQKDDYDFNSSNKLETDQKDTKENNGSKLTGVTPENLSRTNNIKDSVAFETSSFKPENYIKSADINGTPIIYSQNLPLITELSNQIVVFDLQFRKILNQKELFIVISIYNTGTTPGRNGNLIIYSDLKQYNFSKSVELPESRRNLHINKILSNSRYPEIQAFPVSINEFRNIISSDNILIQYNEGNISFSGRVSENTLKVFRTILQQE